MDNAPSWVRPGPLAWGRRRAAICAALLVLAAPGAFSATAAARYQEHPWLGEAAAHSDTQHYLARTFAGWRAREYGYIDCRYGRVNSYIWICAVGWIRGYNCKQGRVRVENEYAEGGITYYGIHFGYRRC